MNPAAIAVVAALLASPQVHNRPDEWTAAGGSVVTSDTRPATLSGVIRGLPGDFRRMASRQSLLILGAGGGLALAVSPADATITQSAVTSRALDQTLEAGDALGNGYVQVGAALGTLLIGQAFGKPSVAATGADLLGAQFVNGIITLTLKVTVRRTRPNGGEYSFPSGHASATFATASVLERRFGWKVGIPAYALGGYVAASRVQQNQHYLSDVIFGATIGIASGRAVVLPGPARALRASVVPMRGGVAVLFVQNPTR
jgi:membrane-associated phospholipid phosphatase